MAWTPLVDTDITVATSIATSHDLLVVVVPHNTTLLDDEQEDMVFKNDTRTAEAVKYLLTTDDVKSVIRYENAQDSGGGTVTRLLVVELPANEDNAGVLGRKVAASVVSALKSEKAGVKSCGIQLSLVWGESTGASADFLSECTCSIMTGLYNDRRYKGTLEGAQKNAKPSLKWIEFITPASSSKDDSAAATKAVEKGAILARGVYLSKDIVNAPHNSLNSYGLATTARKVASQSRGRLSCQILEQADIEKRGMGAFLGVARGSETYPKLIHLTYKPKKKGTKMNPLKKLGVVGKGLLFDTGGYSIKTQMMELMKACNVADIRRCLCCLVFGVLCIARRVISYLLLVVIITQTPRHIAHALFSSILYSSV
jgi:leucyl aminopeptidase